MHNIQRCGCCQNSHFNAKKVLVGNIVVLDEKNTLIRNTRDGTMIKMDVNNGVYTMDMWICFDDFSDGRHTTHPSPNVRKNT